MANGMDVYLHSLGLANPIASYKAGAEIAESHRRILDQEAAATFDQNYKLLSLQQNARQTDQQNELAQARLAETARQNDARNTLTSQHYSDQADHWNNPAAAKGGWTPPPPMDDSSGSGPSMTPAESEWLRRNDANPAPEGTQTDDRSFYAPGSAPAPAYSDGPIVPGGQSFPAESQGEPQARSQQGMPVRPTEQESQGMGGGLLPPIEQQESPQTQAPQQAKVFRETDTLRRTESTLPDGSTQIIREKWDGRNGGRWTPFGQAHTVKKDTGTPPPAVDANPDSRTAEGVRNFGDGLGEKTYENEGRTVVQPMAWDGKTARWKPRGSIQKLPQKTEDGSLPDPVSHDGYISFPLPKDKGGFSWVTKPAPPALDAKIQILKDAGFKPTKVNIGNNGAASVQGVALDTDSATAPEGSPTKIISKLPAASRGPSVATFNAILSPEKIIDPATKQPMPVTDVEKAKAMGKEPSQMTPEDWKAGYAAALQRRRESAATDFSKTLNSMLKDTKGFVPRTPEYWLHYIDSAVMPQVDSTQPQQASAPAGQFNPSAPTKGFSDEDLRGMGVGQPQSPPASSSGWMKKLGIGG